MEISKLETEKILKETAETELRARRMVMYKGADVLYLIWGTIWMLGFAAQQYLPGKLYHFGRFATPDFSMVWTVLVIAGGVASWLAFRHRVPVKSSESKAIGIFWLVLFGYIYLWLFLLRPLMPDSLFHSIENQRHFTAIITTVPMFAYVVMGLMGCGYYMVWLGLGVTVLTVMGLYVMPQYYYLWMAVLGGGALFLAGILTRRQWRKA